MFLESPLSSLPPCGLLVKEKPGNLRIYGEDLLSVFALWTTISPHEALVSRKHCDFENAEMLRFEIVLPTEDRSDFLFLRVWAPSTCLCCLTIKKSQSKNIAIWNLRFRNAAICDFIPRFFYDFLRNLQRELRV